MPERPRPARGLGRAAQGLLAAADVAECFGGRGEKFCGGSDEALGGASGGDSRHDGADRQLPASEQVELTDRQIEAAGLAGIAASGRRSSGDIGGAAAGEVQIAMSSRARDGEKSSV